MYVPWGVIEPEPGVFNLEKPNMLHFLDLCKKYGLYVYFRPGPYIANEMDAGGFPTWLLKDTTKTSREADGRIALRDNDPDFLKLVERYFNVINIAIKPYLSTNGGPIILYAIENEYDWFKDITETEKLFMYKGDFERPLTYQVDINGYFRALRDMVREDNIDVPLTTCPGKNLRGLGTVSDIIPMPNLYRPDMIGWNVFNDLTRLHQPDVLKGVYTHMPSGITEADRTSSRMKRIFMSGMDAYFGFDISGMSHEGYLNSITVLELNIWKLFLPGKFHEFAKVGYLHNVVDFFGPISASGALREKFYSFRRANMLLDTLEESIASVLHSKRSGLNPARGEKLDSRLVIKHPEIGDIEGNKKRHYWMDLGEGKYLLHLLNETGKKQVLDKHSVTIDGFSFPRYTKLTIHPEPEPGVYYSDTGDDLINSMIIPVNMDIVKDLELYYTTSDLLTVRKFNDETLMVLYGVKGSQGELALRFDSENYRIDKKSAGIKLEKRYKDLYAVSYTYDKNETLELTTATGNKVKILILNRHDAGRAWFLKKGSEDLLVIGPDYIDETSEGSYDFEFSDAHKKREVLVLSNEELSLGGLRKTIDFNEDTKLTEFVHDREFKFPDFKGDLTKGRVKSDKDEVRVNFNEKSGVTFSGQPVPLETLNISKGHAWYRTEFEILEKEIEKAHLYIESASDFVSIYVNGSYLTSLAPLGTEISSNHHSPDYSFPGLSKLLKPGKNIISFKVEIWGHGSFAFPRGKIFYNFARLPSIGTDSIKGLYGQATIDVWGKGGTKPAVYVLNKWWVRKSLTGMNSGFQNESFRDASWEAASLPLSLPAGEVLWYRTTFRKDELPDVKLFNSPMVLSLKGRSSKATIYLNGRLVGRWLSDNTWIRRGTWVKSQRDLMARNNPDHFPIPVESLNSGENTLSVAFEDMSAPYLEKPGEITELKIKFNQERLGDSKADERIDHMLRSIRFPVFIN